MLLKQWSKTTSRRTLLGMKLALRFPYEDSLQYISHQLLMSDFCHSNKVSDSVFDHLMVFRGIQFNLFFLTEYWKSVEIRLEKYK